MDNACASNGYIRCFINYKLPTSPPVTAHLQTARAYISSGCVSGQIARITEILSVTYTMMEYSNRQGYAPALPYSDKEELEPDRIIVSISDSW